MFLYYLLSPWPKFSVLRLCYKASGFRLQASLIEPYLSSKWWSSAVRLLTFSCHMETTHKSIDNIVHPIHFIIQGSPLVSWDLSQQISAMGPYAWLFFWSYSQDHARILLTPIWALRLFIHLYPLCFPYFRISIPIYTHMKPWKTWEKNVHIVREKLNNLSCHLPPQEALHKQ